jgi:hypothetical protein
VQSFLLSFSFHFKEVHKVYFIVYLTDFFQSLDRGLYYDIEIHVFIAVIIFSPVELLFEKDLNLDSYFFEISPAGYADQKSMFKPFLGSRKKNPKWRKCATNSATLNPTPDRFCFLEKTMQKFIRLSTSKLIGTDIVLFRFDQRVKGSIPLESNFFN